MNLDNIPFIDDDDSSKSESNEILDDDDDYINICEISSLTNATQFQEQLNFNNDSTRYKELYENESFEKDKIEKKIAKFPKWKFFKTTFVSLIIMVLYYIDIATDLILLIDYATNKMWGFFSLTLLFILMPFLIVWTGNFNALKTYSFFPNVLAILGVPFYSGIS